MGALRDGKLCSVSRGRPVPRAGVSTRGLPRGDVGFRLVAYLDLIDKVLIQAAQWSLERWVIHHRAR